MPDSPDTDGFTFPHFEPLELPVVEVIPYDVRDTQLQQNLPDQITVDLNYGDATYVSLWVESSAVPGVWVDLHPAEALELGRRLLVCAEAAVRYAALDPAPVEGEQEGGTA